MAATDPKLLAALRAKLGGVSSQAISQRRQRLQGLVPMPTDIATYVIAQREGLKLNRYIKDAEVLGRVADADARLHAKEAMSKTSDPLPPTKAPTRKKTKKAAAPRVVFAGRDEIAIPGLAPSHAKEARAMAERVYPVLYLFENSVRDLIERVLASAYGKDWWNVAVSPTIREQAEKFKQDEKKDTWHGKRGRRDIDYLLLTQLWAIIRNRWKDFEPLFPQGQAWVQSLIESDMNVSRRVIAHMNPLAEDDIKGLEASFRKWVKHLQAVEDLIP